MACPLVALLFWLYRRHKTRCRAAQPAGRLAIISVGLLVLPPVTYAGMPDAHQVLDAAQPRRRRHQALPSPSWWYPPMKNVAMSPASRAKFLIAGATSTWLPFFAAYLASADGNDAASELQRLDRNLAIHAGAR